jgi:hypothetical protein
MQQENMIFDNMTRKRARSTTIKFQTDECDINVLNDIIYLEKCGVWGSKAIQHICAV